MSGLVDLVFPDGIIALDDIVKIGEPRDIQRSWGRERVREIKCSDGSTRMMGVSFVDSLMRRPMQLMPAAAGTFTLRAWGDEAERGVDKTAVIAWALCVDGDVRPVTPQGVNDGGMMFDTEGYVLMPDGTVQSIGEHAEPVWFDDLDEYSEHMWERLAVERAAAAIPAEPADGGAA